MRNEKMIYAAVVVALGGLALSTAVAGVVTGPPVAAFTTTNNSRDIPLSAGSPNFTADLTTWNSFSSQLHSILGIGTAVGNADVEHQDASSPDQIHGDIALPYAMVGRGADGAFAYFVYKFVLPAGSLTGPGGTINSGVYFRHDPVGTHGQNAYIGVSDTLGVETNLSSITNAGSFSKLTMEQQFAPGHGYDSYVGNAELAIPAGLSQFYVIFTDEGSSARFAMTSMNVNSVIVPLGDPEWFVNRSGDWNDNGNWANGVPNSVGAVAQFTGAISSPKTVYTDIPVTVGTLRFNNAASYQIAGQGSLTVDVNSGNGLIEVLQGSHKINLPLTIADNTTASVAAGSTLKISNPMTLAGGSVLTKTGAGTLSIEAPVTNASLATLRSSGGTTNALMDLGANTTLQVTTGTANLKATQHLAGLSVTGGSVVAGTASSGVTVSTRSIAVSSGASLDLTSSKLIAYYTAGNSPLNAIRTAITSGAITSTALGAGKGIGSADAAAINVTSFGGETLTGSAVLVRMTYLGDTDLNGIVNFDDLLSLAQNYGLAGVWSKGDFNYDNLINFDDLLPLAQNYGQSLPASVGGIGSDTFQSDWALALSVVPEPTSIAFLAFGATAGIRRARR